MSIPGTPAPYHDKGWTPTLGGTGITINEPVPPDDGRNGVRTPWRYRPVATRLRI